jgi:hypothetical protein
VHNGELREGRQRRIGPREEDLYDGREGARLGLQRVIAMAFLGHSKGRVRLVVHRGVHARWKEAPIGLRIVAFDPSSPQISSLGFSSPPLI